MQITTKHLSDTTVQLTLIADTEQLLKAKEQTLKALAKDMKLPGFRPGKAPLQLVEKNARPNVLQNEVMERAINILYGQSLDQENLRPVAQPQVTVKKFVPFTTLEVEVSVEIIGKVSLVDYKKLKHSKKVVKLTAKDIAEVISQLQTREAAKIDVERTAQNGDQIIIDFTGVDAKTGEPIGGADGKNYPLALGSNTFIPGFEPNLIGLKADDNKIFSVTFPEDYSVATLQNRNVEFNVTVKKVQALDKPQADDAFAAKIGPFTSLAELKEDIKKQLTVEQENQAQRDFEELILNDVADQSKVAIPAVLIEDEIARMEADERQNLTYRGQTWQEHLETEGINEEQHREQKREQAQRRVKAGLVLAEIAEQEHIVITPDDADARIQLLKNQYQDKTMQAVLNKPENRREIASRLLTEKTIEKLVQYTTSK